MTPLSRIRSLNACPQDPNGDFVLYWMTSARRSFFNFGLERAAEVAKALQKPLVILEALRCDYPWASARFHRFVLDGMAFNSAYFAAFATYIPYVEPSKGAGRGLLERLSERACAVISDDFPCFFLPHMTDAAASKVRVSFEAIDSNGLLPIRQTEKLFKRAVDFRGYLRRNVWPYLAQTPLAEPLRTFPLKKLSAKALKRLKKDISPWKNDSLADICTPDHFGSLPINHAISAVQGVLGGPEAARRRLSSFVAEKLFNYDEGRAHPDEDASSGLSPYLHFGHISAHEVFGAIAAVDPTWSIEHAEAAANRRPARAPKNAPEPQETESQSAWWGFSRPAVGAFTEQLVTWRELGFNACIHDPNYASYTSLPAWSQKTLSEHRKDPRPHIYDLATLANAHTEDPLWNAAQRQLVREGTIHNYLRMLWGKRVLAWTETPEIALHCLIELNNRYALDGRDPNSYSGIFWVFGRYDRAWGPERPIYGKIRYMTSDSAQHKLRLKQYLLKYDA